MLLLMLSRTRNTSIVIPYVDAASHDSRSYVGDGLLVLDDNALQQATICSTQYVEGHNIVSQWLREYLPHWY